MNCLSCGKAVDAEDRFCAACGTPVDAQMDGDIGATGAISATTIADTRCGEDSAISMAILPPRECPTRLTRSSPCESIHATTVSAMLASVASASHPERP